MNANSAPIYAPVRKTGPLGSQYIRLLIADDIAMLRGELRRMCETEKDLKIVAETGSGLQAIQLACETRPDVILLDSQLPDLDSASIIRQILRCLPDTRFIVLASPEQEELVLEALRAGACAHLPKKVQCQQLLVTIRAAHQGQAQIDSSVTARVLQELRSASQPEG